MRVETTRYFDTKKDRGKEAGLFHSFPQHSAPKAIIIRLSGEVAELGNEKGPELHLNPVNCEDDLCTAINARSA